MEATIEHRFTASYLTSFSERSSGEHRSVGQPPIATTLSAAGVFTLAVVQQPPGRPTYVAVQEGAVTQFRLASDHGVTGLLAHNDLAGRWFYRLAPGQIVTVAYAGAIPRSYRVTGLYAFQRLSPGSPYSPLVDLASGERLSSSQVFDCFYTNPHRLALQTCLERHGNHRWGLTFVVAEAVSGRGRSGTTGIPP